MSALALAVRANRGSIAWRDQSWSHVHALRVCSMASDTRQATLGALSVRSTPLHLSLLYVSLRDLTLAADGPCSWCTTARRTSRRRPLSAPRRRRALRRARARSRSDRGCLWRAPPSLRRARRGVSKGRGSFRTSPCRPPRRRRSPRQPSASALRAANAWDELARLHKDRLREGSMVQCAGRGL